MNARCAIYLKIFCNYRVQNSNEGEDFDVIFTFFWCSISRKLIDKQR